MNTLYYGDNLKILRDYIKDESVDLVYLDPPFNSNRNYNVLFRNESGSDSESQITAFEDTWHWNLAAEQTYSALINEPDQVGANDRELSPVHRQQPDDGLPRHDGRPVLCPEVASVMISAMKAQPTLYESFEPVVPANPVNEQKRTVKNGHPTNDLLFSASMEGNDRVFPQILRLYVKPKSIVADVTYGKGAFWRLVPSGEYQLKATDIQDGVDCRDLPYKGGEIDCVVFDPPYMHSPGGSAHTVHTQFEDHYRNNATGNLTNSKYHEAVLDLYRDGGKEAYRVLKDRGVFIVKCQDEVCANQQRFTHIEIMATYEEMGFVAEDLFVVVRNNRPGVSRVVQQVHARKNHSYFLVFWKSDGGKKRWLPPQ